jgi:alpha-D-xyloside xylohydrolase
VRPGAVLPIGARDDRPDYGYDDDVTLRVYELDDGDRTTVTVPDTAGEAAATFDVARDDGTLTVTREHGNAAWRLLLVGASDVTTVDGGTPAQNANGTEISVPADTARCSIEL